MWIAPVAVGAQALLPQVELPWWLPGYGDWSAVARYAVPVAVLAVLARPRIGRPQARSRWWLLLSAVAAFPLEGDAWALARAGLHVGLLLVVLVVVVGALDPRPAIGAAVYLAPGLLHAAEESTTAGAPSNLALGYWAVLAALMVALAATAWRIRRQQLTQPQP